jgi:alpha-maltose-1-phosphate synthase
MAQPTAIVVNPSTSGSRLGGAAIAAEWHSRCMATHYPVELWRMWDGDGQMQLDDLTVRQFRSGSQYGQLGERLPRQARALFLRSAILEHLLMAQPGIVHLQNPVPALEFERIARQSSAAGIKVVASTHGFFEVLNPNYGLGLAQRWAWKRWVTQPILRSLPYLDAIVSGYPAEKDLLIQHGVAKEKIHLIPNGINPFFATPPTAEECAAVASKFAIDQTQPILLFIGNHTANKGLDTVLKIAAQLSQPATVVIGGKLTSPDEPLQWQQKIPPASQVRVVFTDYLSLAEQRSLYHLSTLLLFPSLADTLPLTILEAMASGLPVVAYDVGGIPYQLAEQAGVTVKAGDVPAFLAAVEWLLQAPDLRTELASQAVIRRKQLFCWELAAQNTIQVYQTLLHSSNH